MILTYLRVFLANIKQLTTPHVANPLKFVLSVAASMLANHPPPARPSVDPGLERLALVQDAVDVGSAIGAGLDELAAGLGAPGLGQVDVDDFELFPDR